MPLAKTVHCISKRYKNVFENANTSDASIFMSSLVPTQIISGHLSNSHEMIWQNQCS